MLMDPGWIRFQSDAGGMIPMTCPQTYQCGTIMPIWMQGTLPTAADGIVSRTMCAHINNDCCGYRLQGSVKNCGQFYVYSLESPPSCPMSYCAGGEEPCPFGQTSPTGFPPGCKDAFPLMEEHPKLSGPIIEGKSFRFQCLVDFPKNDPNQAFEVVWTFNGEEDPKISPQILNDPDRVASLDGSLLAGHLNTDVQCKARAYYKDQPDHKGPYLESDPYYAGIKVGPGKLVVGEKDEEKEVTITSTIPPICKHQFQCCLKFQLDMSSLKDAVVRNKCVYDLCTDDWDAATNTASVKVPVDATQDMVNDLDTDLLLTFEPLAVFGLGDYMDIFSGYRPPQVQVDVPDKASSSCGITGDPHFTGFDNGPYHLYKTGDYTVAKIEERDFEVQIRTWPCMNRVSCICGIVVREGNDLIRIDQCNQQYGGASTAPKITTPRELGEGTIVKRREDGRNFGIYLQSGAEIQLTAFTTHMNLHITLPGKDFGDAVGICGTNDKVRGNDFTYPNGHVDTVCNNCIPDKFTEAWRVDVSESLFEVLPPLVQEEDNVKYCICKKGDDGKPIATCDARANVPGTGVACQGCPVIAPPVVSNNWGSNPPTTGKRDVMYEDDDLPDEPFVQTDVPDVDPNKKFPNADGITDSQARGMCEEAIRKSQLGSKKDEMKDIFDTCIENCMSDILFGETTAFLDSITETFTVLVQVSLAKDPANYVTDANGKSVLKPEYLGDICDLQCQEHGRCGQGGVCECQLGWEGVNCQIQSGLGPQIERLRRGELCDRAQRPCRKTFLDVSNVDLSERLVCRVQKIDENGNHQDIPIDTEVETFSPFRVACILPKTVVSSQRYKISLSNDGDLFGNTRILRVYDSTCLDCSESSCRNKNIACRIDNVCHHDGDVKEDDRLRVCDITKSTTEWTLLKKPDISHFCDELQDGFYEHPYDCTKFIRCLAHCVHIKSCPNGHMYNPELKSCREADPLEIAVCACEDE